MPRLGGDDIDGQPRGEKPRLRTPTKKRASACVKTTHAADFCGWKMCFAENRKKRGPEQLCPRSSPRILRVVEDVPARVSEARRGEVLKA